MQIRRNPNRRGCRWTWGWNHGVLPGILPRWCKCGPRASLLEDHAQDFLEWSGPVSSLWLVGKGHQNVQRLGHPLLRHPHPLYSEFRALRVYIKLTVWRTPGPQCGSSGIVMQLTGVVKRPFNQGTRAQYQRNSQGQTPEFSISLNVIFQTLCVTAFQQKIHMQTKCIFWHKLSKWVSY